MVLDSKQQKRFLRPAHSRWSPWLRPDLRANPSSGSGARHWSAPPCFLLFIPPSRLTCSAYAPRSARLAFSRPAATEIGLRAEPGTAAGARFTANFTGNFPGLVHAWTQDIESGDESGAEPMLERLGPRFVALAAAIGAVVLAAPVTLVVGAPFFF